MSERRKVEVHKTPLGYDSWGKSKTIIDFSLFHGVWSFEVPKEMWIEIVDTVEQTGFVNFSSVNGMMKCQGVAGQENHLMSKRHPRYQPNKGHLYSTSMILPDASVAVNQEFGIFTKQNGVFFRVNNGILYAVRRTLLDATIVDTAEVMDLTDIDLTKGNLYDIQMQWRGVGNIYYFVNQVLVHTMELVGTLDAPSVSNPSLPIGYRVDGLATMYAVCVDVTSEGGHKENRQRGVIDSDEVVLSNTEIPVLLLHMNTSIDYNGTQIMNTRDIALRRISGYADDATVLRMYISRDSSKFTGTVFTDYNGIGSIEYSITPNIIVDNLTTNIKRQVTRRIPALGNVEITNPDSEVGDFYVTHGDYVLITMKAKNATVGGASLEWGAEI